MMGAVLNSLNIRLDPKTIRFILEHGEAKVLLADLAFAEVLETVVKDLNRDILIVQIGDSDEGLSDPNGKTTYESLLSEGSDSFVSDEPQDEWQALSLLYTSGTTGDPKGCVYHHRGAYLSAMANMNTVGLNRDSIYLWTLPMFHCDGWTFTWAVTAAMATHVCLRQMDPGYIFQLIRDEKVSHMCGAPIVLNMLANARADQKCTFPQIVEISTGGAAPPSAVIEAMEEHGFRVTHLYGLTETYGPATVCIPQVDWPELSTTQRSAKMARQGVYYATLEGGTVKDPETMEDVPWDGRTLGEVMVRGNTVMKGYLKNSTATDACFSGGWFHSGDIAVRHSDGYIEVKDRSKDIIISGGENISSLEVEETLYRHPDILEAAVVARPDPKWGESPCAFVTLHDGVKPDEANVVDYCRQHLAGFKVPRSVVFGPLPKTSTGKIQKFLLRDRASELES
jgi:fatty-acyl-CoA synthase